MAALAVNGKSCSQLFVSDLLTTIAAVLVPQISSLVINLRMVTKCMKELDGGEARDGEV